MADHIPFITSEDSANLVNSFYADSDFVRITVERADALTPGVSGYAKIWVDPCVDGMDDVRKKEETSWFRFMQEFPYFEKIADGSYHAKPSASEIRSFVTSVLDRCLACKPAWITVPQFPLVQGADRNKINRALALETGKWKDQSGFPGRLILPLVVTNQNQVNKKTARNPKVEQAERCYHSAQADGFWIVDKSLADDSGLSTLGGKRFPAIISLHEELNARIPSKIRIAGPYWGLNLVLWAKGLVDFPAIGVGSSYQYFLAGGYGKQPAAKVAISSLRRRADVDGQFREWLDKVVAKLSPSNPVRKEFTGFLSNYTALSDRKAARAQVAEVYKKWFDTIASVPKGGRSMAMYQDFSLAYALGKSLPEMKKTGSSRRPEAVAEPLMLNCL